MAFLGQTYSTDTLPESTPSDPIPAGWYSATITEAGVNSTKAGTGEYIKIRYDVTGPSYEGRVVFGNLNIRNPNPKAEEIGRQQLGELMRAIGLTEVSDSDQLIGGQCRIKVAIREDASGQYAPQNEVKAWKALDGSKPPAPRPSVASAPAPSANASAAPPWARK
jgi:hypothetical protein